VARPDRPSGCGQDKRCCVSPQSGSQSFTKSASLSGSITLGRLSTSPSSSRRHCGGRRDDGVPGSRNPFPMSVFDNVAYVLREQGQAQRPRQSQVLGAAGRGRRCLARGLPGGGQGNNLHPPALRAFGGQQGAGLLHRTCGLPQTRRCCCWTKPWLGRSTRKFEPSDRGT